MNNMVDDFRLSLATDDFERETITNLKNVDDLIAQNYWFWNWEKQEFEADFMCEEHINESFKVEGEWEHIHQVAAQENALIATVIETSPLIIEPGVHYCNRYGYIVYKGEELKEDYYI